jgi:riboflavin biosynthesis pyrimidine reductase
MHFKSIEDVKKAFVDIDKGSRFVYSSAAITLDGKLNSNRKPLGGEIDRDWYRFLVERADQIIIGGETFRGSGAKKDTRYQGRAISVLSNSLNLPLDAKAITGSEELTVYTNKDLNSPQAKRIEALSENNSVKRFTSAQDIIDKSKGSVLIDGGGEIYTLFAPFIDDWFLTLVPRFGPNKKTSIWLSDFDSPELEPDWVFSKESRLFCRFRKSKFLPNEKK